jgi:ketosteroid isomerase-like protein
MSQENVAKFLEATAALNRRDVEGWLEAYDQDAVFEPRVAAFEGSFSGHDGLKQFFDDVADRLDFLELTFDDVRDLGDRVLALGADRGRGKGSGAEITGVLAVVATFRDGKCVHLKDYGDRSAALEAVGLSE